MGEKVYGLLGRKLGHSWSVPIHRALGCRDYRLCEVEPQDLAAFLAREEVGGLNVTIPYKQDVMAYCDEIDEDARAIGSVNTIVRGEDGRLLGYNTDLRGFLTMARGAGVDFTGRKVVVLGSGGASLTVQAAARMEGAREVVVISRTGPDNYDNLERRNGDAEILVNATPVGMWPQLEGQPVDLCRLPQLEVVLDLVYNPLRTSLLLQAQERGIPCCGGLPMLVEQAVAAEELFFGRSVPQKSGDILAKLWRARANIELVGMPGCGKTTVGRALAALSGRTLVDLDEEIVRRTGLSIPEIFQQEGEGAFRELEVQAVERAAGQSGWIIATGGGAVLDEGNRQALRRTGRVYFLQRRLELLPVEGRPLSQGRGLEELYRGRLPLYQATADVTIDNDAGAEAAAEAIWRDFCAYLGY